MKMQKMHKITKKNFFLNGFEKLYLLGIPHSSTNLSLFLLLIR